MNIKTISQKELGINCWRSERFFGKCWDCERYSKCNYPEKVVNEEYDKAVEKYKVALKELTETKTRLRKGQAND